MIQSKIQVEDLKAKERFLIVVFDFQHGVLTIEDMAEIGVPDNDRSHLMESIKDLPKATTIAQQGLENAEENGKDEHTTVVKPKLPTVEQWLKDIDLEDYKEIFR